MNLTSRALSTLSHVFTGVSFFGNSKEDSENRAYKVGSIVKLPFKLLAAFGLLMTSAKADFVHSPYNESGIYSVANIMAHPSGFVHSPYNESGIYSVANIMEHPIESSSSTESFLDSNDPDLITSVIRPLPELEITSIHEETECETKVREVIKSMHECPVALDFYRKSARSGFGIVCTSEDIGSFSFFDIETKKVIFSVGEEEQHPKSKYMVSILKELNSLEVAEIFKEFEKNRCNMSRVEYVKSKTSFFSSRTHNKDTDIETQCIEEGHWPEDFHLNNLVARTIIPEDISPRVLEKVLSKLKSMLRKEEVKELEDANEEEVIKLAVKLWSRVLEREREEWFEATDYQETANYITEEWNKNCHKLEPATI